ncbi:hypothetical protein O9993_21615 [Vibrio lentus]|nr:hypothetical protein [Vibrio lentus]
MVRDSSNAIRRSKLLANTADIEGDDLVASDLTRVGDDAAIVTMAMARYDAQARTVATSMLPTASAMATHQCRPQPGLLGDPVNDAPIVSADVAITIEEDGFIISPFPKNSQFATDIEDDDMTHCRRPG